MVVRILSRVWGSLGFGLLSQAGASRTQKARSSGRVPKLKVDIDLQLKVQEVAPVDVDDRDLSSSSSSDDESSSSSSQNSAEESDGERAGLADNAPFFPDLSEQAVSEGLSSTC